MIDTVFWDIGGVITESPFERFREFEQKHNLPVDFIRTVNSQNPDTNAWAKLERSEVSTPQFDELFEQETTKYGHAVHGSLVRELLQVKVREKVVAAISKLKELGLLQVAVTNNIFQEKNNHSMSQHTSEVSHAMFDHIFESRELGIRKPEPEFYLKVMEKIHKKPENIVYLDDLGINLKPAKAMGMTTIKVLNEKQALNDLSNVLQLDLA